MTKNRMNNVGIFQMCADFFSKKKKAQSEDWAFAGTGFGLAGLVGASLEPAVDVVDGFQVHRGNFAVRLHDDETVEHHVRFPEPGKIGVGHGQLDGRAVGTDKNVFHRVALGVEGLLGGHIFESLVNAAAEEIRPGRSALPPGAYRFFLDAVLFAVGFFALRYSLGVGDAGCATEIESGAAMGDFALGLRADGFIDDISRLEGASTQGRIVGVNRNTGQVFPRTFRDLFLAFFSQGIAVLVPMAHAVDINLNRFNRYLGFVVHVILLQNDRHQVPLVNSK